MTLLNFPVPAASSNPETIAGPVCVFRTFRNEKKKPAITSTKLAVATDLVETKEIDFVKNNGIITAFLKWLASAIFARHE